MDNKICIGYLTNIRDMFVIGSERCEGEALKYHQNFIDALNYAIKELEERPRLQGEWICTFHSTFPQYEPDEYRCSICNCVGNKRDKFCNVCGAQMKGGTE